ncbi:MAG: hypothetical protein V4801_38040 [Burkholderia gladioli]
MRGRIRMLLAALVAAGCCAGCANGGGGGMSDGGHGSIEMYGTIDQGVTVHN